MTTERRLHRRVKSKSIPVLDSFHSKKNGTETQSLCGCVWRRFRFYFALGKYKKSQKGSLIRVVLASYSCENLAVLIRGGILDTSGKPEPLKDMLTLELDWLSRRVTSFKANHSGWSIGICKNQRWPLCIRLFAFFK